MTFQIWRLAVVAGLVLLTSITPVAQGHIASPSPTNQEVAGAFWRVDHSFQSTLRMKNELAKSSLVVWPVLFMEDGTEYDLPSIEVPQSGQVNIDINAALQSAPPSMKRHLSLFGTATIRFVHGWKPLEVSIENIDLPRSLIFNYHMTNSPARHSGDHSFQGLWWKATEATRGFIALSNMGSSGLMPAYEIQSKSGTTLTSGYVKLASHATQVLDLQKLISRAGDDESSVGGISIQYHGQDGTLAVAGGLEDANVGFSAVLPFTSTDAPNDADAKPAD